MALVSPGVQVTVIDESNYAPAALGSVAYLLLATAENKVAPGGTAFAAGTLAENAGKVYTITSQRDLVTTFGTPIFKTTAGGAPINGDEQNEYGLLAAYSALGVSNTIYIQRADVDLGALNGTTTRPLSNPSAGNLWLDVASSNWGIFEWNASTNSFTQKTPSVITSTEYLASDNFTPNATVGTVGDYIVNAYDNENPVFYKRYDNTWQQVGNVGWQTGIPTVTGTQTNPVVASTSYILINGTNVSITSASNVTTIAAQINSAGVTGILARVSNGQLVITANSAATNSAANIQAGVGGGNAISTLGITAGTYPAAATSIAPYFSVPVWQSNAAPTGSVWQKASALGNGENMALKEFNSSTLAWNPLTVNSYANVFAATFGLDPTGGGSNIIEGTAFNQYNPNENNTLANQIWYRKNTGATILTGNTTSPVVPGVGAAFTIQTRANASLSTVTTVSVTVSTGTINGLIQAIASACGTAGVTDIVGGVDSSGAFTITHQKGGDMVLTDGVQTPLSNVAIVAGATNVYASPANASVLIGTNWQPLSNENTYDKPYTASITQPYNAPANGTLWYYNTPSRVDVMVSNGSAWLGYQNLSSDIRGYNLTQTNPNGPIISTSQPTKQDDSTPLVLGDLWLDSSDLENYPKLYRYQNVSGINQWVLIDNTDSVSQNGILFADARWAPDGAVNTTDPATDAIPTIKSLLTSNHTDLDAPDPALYPRGTLLWNTRASGYNVKEYRPNYFSQQAYPLDPTQTETGAWVTVSGFDVTGVPNFGRKAPRGVVVAALKSSIDSSTELREDANQFNLISCPGYPELIPNMIALNEDRDNTAFIIGDSPLRLQATGTAIQGWAQNTSDITSTGEYGLATVNPYVGVYYPQGQTNDLSGTAVVVPSSHAVIRAMIKSDNISYPWLAPAGTRRGLIDNLNAIGYIDEASGRFISIGVTQGLRDVMYTNKINPLTFLPGNGLLIYGQKTLSSTPSALDRINVARLVNYLRQQLNVIARPFIFEPNDPITRNGILTVVNSLLNDLVSKRGITDYLAVCDSSNNTPERIARNELYVDVAIQPTKDVEFIYIPIRLKNPGEIQAGNFASASAVGTGA